MRVRGMVLLVLVSLIVSVCLPALSFAVIWNVPADAPTIQAGIDSAGVGQDTVVVECGTYYEYNIAMREGVYLTSATGEFDCVTIDAHQLGRVFNCNGLSQSTVIKGFTIKGGQSATQGGGMYLDSSSPKIINCHITDNRLTDWNENGVGMYLYRYSDPEVTGCVLSGNMCANPSNGHGGGVFMTSYCDPVFTNCTFYGNRASYGSQVKVWSDCLPQFDNCIVAGGIGNPEPAFACGSGGTPTLICCDVYGNESGDWAGCLAGMDTLNNNFSEDPLFCDPGAKDFHLRNCSPCADAPGCGLVGALGVGGCTFTWEVPSEISSIQAAIDTSCAGDTILVSDGDYFENLTMKGDVYVMSESDDPEAAIINGGGLGPVVFCSNLAGTPYLRGFTVTNGLANYGGGVHCNNASVEITNCHIVDNHANVDGGGIYCGNAGDPVFTDCLIKSNGAGGEGGAYWGVVTQPTFVKCTFYGNGAPVGGGLYSNGVGSVIFLRHSIVAFGYAGEAVYCELAGTANLDCTDVFGNAGGDWTGFIKAQESLNDNLWADPVFCDTANGDFHLASDSPCLSDACGVIGAFDRGCLGERPMIRDAQDVGNDQGRFLRLTWERNMHDGPGLTYDITGYEIYRRQDAYLLDGGRDAVQMLGSPGPGTEPLLAGWDYIATVPAHGESLYQYVAPTLCDSTFFEGICWSVFFVRAATDNPLDYFDSPADSGYSIDNLAPGPPPGLMLADATTLVWEEVADEDLFFYTVYGSDQPELDETATLIAETPRLNQIVPGDVFDYFHVTAVDFSGNEGDESSVANLYAGVVPEDRPAVNALMQNRPNPFEAATLIRFDLAKPGMVRLSVYDVGGELVRTLTDESWPAGRHSLNWMGDDARGHEAGPGIYFLRMEASQFRATRKVIILK